MVGTGYTSRRELAADTALAAAHGYVSPFVAAGAVDVGRAPLRCTVMEGAFKRPPMDEGDTRSAVGLWRGEPAQPLIHHPVWRQYQALLAARTAAATAAASARVELPTAAPAAPAPEVRYDAFLAAVRSASGFTYP